MPQKQILVLLPLLLLHRMSKVGPMTNQIQLKFVISYITQLLTFIFDNLFLWNLFRDVWLTTDLYRPPPLLPLTPTTASTKSNALEAETAVMDNVAVVDEAVEIEAVADTEVITVEDEVGVDHAEVLVATVEDHDVVKSPKLLI